MMNAVRAEWIKLRTIRSTWVLLIISIALTLVISIPISIFGKDFDRNETSMITLILIGVTLSTSLVGVVATLLASGDFRFTIRQTYAAEPRRLRVFGAKVITATLAIGAVGAAMIGLALGSSALILKARHLHLSFDHQGWSNAIGAWIYMILFSLAGLAIAHIIRHSAGSIVTLLVWSIVLENILFGLSMAFFKSATRYLPFNAGQQLYSASNNANNNLDIRLFSRWTGGLYFAGFVALLLGVGAFFVQRRDA